MKQLVGILLLIVPGPGGRVSVRPRLHLMVDNIRQIYSHKIHIFLVSNVLRSVLTVSSVLKLWETENKVVEV